MPSKKFVSVSDMLKDMMGTIPVSNDKPPYIPSIMEFCESTKYLDFPHTGIQLYPMQKIMFKVFYRGSAGNENLKLEDEEIELLKKLELTNDENGNVLQKYESNKIFRELVLVWGRRSGKDFCVGTVACYEAMRLLECPGGDPYAVYNIAASAPITILTIATAAGQAQLAFNEMKSKILKSPYFADKFIPDGITSNQIFLLTPKDKEENKEFERKKLPLKKGSICLEVGHSNSDTLLGKSVFVLILDEVASYKQTGSASSGERIYTAMTPSLNTFGRNLPVLDEDGKQKISVDGVPVTRRVYDSKILSISSPRGQEGIFYKIFKETHDVEDRLSCRLPTWSVNPRESIESLRRANPNMTEEEFWMEIGAEFSGTAGENAFPAESVKHCFELGRQFGVKNKDLGRPGFLYFAHLDPASTSHNYALVVLHRENFINKETKKNDFVIVVDHVKFWHPTPGKPVKVEEVDDYVIKMRRRFNLGLVTYDQWNTCHYLTRICTAKGLQKVIDVQVGDLIRNRKGDIETIVAKKVDLNADCLTVRTKFGYEATVTKNHPFWNGSDFIYAKDLDIGDRIDLQDFTHFGNVHDPDTALMMGYLVSEGYISEKEDTAVFTNTDYEVFQDYLAVAEKVMGDKPYIHKRGKKQKEYHLDSWNANYFGERARKIKGIVSGDCYSKSVPDFVMNGDKETVSSFISSLYEGDGNVCHNPKALSVEYNTSSKELAKDLQLLLLCFGIKSSLRYFTNKFLDGKQYPFYRITIYGENIDIFAREINFRSMTKKNVLKEVIRLKNDVDLRPYYKRKSRGIRKIVGKKKSRSRQMFDKVVSIEPTTATICHLEVSGDHTYISNGLVSHNSLESIKKLQSNGIPAKCTRYNHVYKMKIYDELYNLIVSGKLILPEDHLLKNELLNIQRKPLGSNGYRIFPRREGDVTTDDLVDSLAGACYNSINVFANRLPKAKLVNTGICGQSNQIQWNSMSGPLGFGSGEQVAKRLENRSRLPQYPRR